MITKQIMICDAIIDMLKIFADTEISGLMEGLEIYKIGYGGIKYE